MNFYNQFGVDFGPQDTVVRSGPFVAQTPAGLLINDERILQGCMRICRQDNSVCDQLSMFVFLIEMGLKIGLRS